MNQNQTESKPETMEEPRDEGLSSSVLLCVGDAVTWTHTTSSKGGFNFSTRNGKIEEIGGFSASVKMRNGRRAWVLLSRLRKDGERTELTEMFMGKDSSHNAAPSRPEHL